MRLIKYCLISLFVLSNFSVFAATKEEALQFLIENLDLNKLTCDYAETKVDTSKGSKFHLSFNPKAVRIREHRGPSKELMDIDCISGLCINTYHTKGDGLTSSNSLEKPESIDAQRIIKAFNFFIDACGGSKKSAF